MPTAKKLPSGSWRVRVFDYTDSDGKKHYKSFTCDDTSPRGKRKAEAVAAEYAVKKEAASHSKLTLGEAMDKYIEARSDVLSPSTIREYKRSRKYDLQGLMDKKVCDITQEQIQAEINKESLNHSPKTVRNMHGLLTTVMKAYRPDFAIRTTLPKKKRASMYVPSDADVEKLMAAVKDTEMEIPILLAAFGPMRRGEICALDSDHVHGNIVHVEYSMALNENGNWVIKAPKSYAGDRYIQYPAFVIDKLKEKTGRIVDFTPLQVSKHFRTILKHLDVPHFRFHDLRHYCASIQHALGIPDAYIMKRGGWSSDAVLKSVYRHTMEEMETAMNNVANEHFFELYDTKYDTK